MRSFGVNINSVERLARDHEKPVSFLAAETQNSRISPAAGSFRCVVRPVRKCAPIVARADPTGRRPNIAVSIRADPSEPPILPLNSIEQTVAVLLVFCRRSRRRHRFHADPSAGVSNIELFVIWREAEAVRFGNLRP